MRQVTVCLIALLAMRAFLFSQDLRTATLVGTVTDSSGAVVPNVAVTLTNVDTQVVTHSVTNAEGAYYLPFINLGNYRLELQASGFKKYVQPGLVLNAGENPPLT